VELLVEALEGLAGDEGRRRSMAEAARAYVRTEHDLERVADAYAAALEWAAGREGVADSVLGEIAEAAAEVGIGASSPELSELAAAVRSTGVDW
jgi:hypothetical protein